jgi:hypothetical protein
MSGRSYLMALALIGLFDYLVVPGLLTLAGLARLLPELAAAAFVPPLTAAGLGFAVAVVAFRRGLETGAGAAWSLPLMVWVTTGGLFQASAPVAILALLAAGHGTASLDMLSRSVAAVMVLVFVGVYRPPAQRWLGQKLVTLLVWLAILVDFALALPRLLALAGGWLNLIALSEPHVSGTAGRLMGLAYATTPLVAPLADYDRMVTGVPLHLVVLGVGLAMLAAEGEWGAVRHDRVGDLTPLPARSRR